MQANPIRVLLLEQIHPEAVELLRCAGFDVTSLDRALDEDELVAALAQVQLLGIRSKTQVTQKVLDAAPHLLAIGAFCIGTNQIDLVSATAHGVTVFNAPFSNTRSVVEMAIAELISLTRRLTEKNKAMHAGVWDKSADGAHEVRGRTLGIIGYGNIGTQLSVLAENLGMRVLFYDTADRLALGNAHRSASLKELLHDSDVVTLHVDGRPENKNIFGDAEFAAMRQGSIFLNLSRGFVVDYAALRRHVEDGHIVGAAVDVFPVEPKRRGDEFVSELRGLDNVILTPHIGGSTEEAQQDIGQFVANKFLDFVNEGSTALSVNLPGLGLPRRKDTLRLVHLHRNVPGVLARVNGILAEHEVNVEAQLLGTKGDVGYLVTDSVSGTTQEIVDQIRAMPETIRLRVLT
ncbi:phosphoglycerate dehydrogenase [Jatrophihabitans lederbergiae]|uniref:D-3-phosphoglycerate dehydrogenase n=1 Tax=Jatrophihabitans lederbergiae TaxID=3075547 RepID=A0ABU2JDZ0_9ACTN|nr:phosphoglycerate dehydrogenase [Jatrophihabitans sp. DSM 44399]MDT0262899.1 phosphoglycerate dehydrogenase [Jatrophihabitans sp. DSM 44399]